MSDEGNLPYDYWREYPEHDPQAFVWYPMTFGPVNIDEIWPKDNFTLKDSTSFYIHVPFCAVVCPFCPFNKYLSREQQMEQYVVAVKTEISLLAERRGWGQADLRAGYFGGGTPTALSGEQLTEIIQHCRRELNIRDNAELTVEGSPETITLDKLKALRDVGVNRISFGVQSFSDHYLRILGRGHDALTARKTIDIVREAGFDNVAIDLMYRLPGQTIEEWAKDLEAAINSGVDHVSTYSLFVEPGSPLASIQHQGRLLPLPDDQTDLDMFDLTIEMLGKAGYELYTLYDFARTGKKSDHHLVNWQAPQAEYVGIGPGAFSFVRNENEEYTYGNINPLDRYFSILADKQLPIDFGIRLSREEQMARYMVIGTNAQPIPKQPFKNRFGVSIEEVYSDTLSQLLEWGLIEDTTEHIALTRRGQLYLANVGKAFSSERNRLKPHPAGVDLQKGKGKSLIGIDSIDTN